MSLALGPDLSSLFAAAQRAPASQWASTCRLIRRNHLFSAKSQIPDALEHLRSFLRQAHSSLCAQLWSRVPSSHRRYASCHVAAWLPGAMRAEPEVSPHSTWAVLEPGALFPGRACPLKVTAVRLVAGPKRLQPAPMNNL